MENGRKAGRVAAVALAVAALGLVLPDTAAAHGRGRGRGFAVGGFYRFNPYFGLGPWAYWGPYAWGPPGYAYGPTGGVDMNVAMIAGFGALEINAKPNRAEVWVDGKYLGEARDLDGYPSYLWLGEGPHTIAVYKGGYATFEERVDVQRGMKRKLKVRLEQGDSPPPGDKPGAEPSEQQESEKQEEEAKAAPKDDSFQGLFN